MAADAAALAAARKVASWIRIRHAVRAVIKAITASVIVVLNVIALLDIVQLSRPG